MKTRIEVDGFETARHAGAMPRASCCDASPVTAVSRPRCAALAIVALALAACSTPEPPPPKAEKLVQRDWVTHVRGGASGVASVVEVLPLDDPELDDLRTTARAQESRGEHEAAVATLDRALALRPDDPTLLQWRAELALMAAAWQDAERIAQRSYELGPQLGEICVRNWLTIEAARIERGDREGATSAAAQVANCQVKPPIRM